MIYAIFAEIFNYGIMATRKATSKPASTGRRKPNTVNSGLTRSRRYGCGGKLSR